MPDTQVVDMFIGAATVCVVMLTLMAAGVAYVVIRAALDVRELVRIARHEAQAYVEARQRIEKRLRLAKAWMRIIARHFIR